MKYFEVFKAGNYPQGKFTQKEQVWNIIILNKKILECFGNVLFNGIGIGGARQLQSLIHQMTYKFLRLLQLYDVAYNEPFHYDRSFFALLNKFFWIL